MQTLKDSELRYRRLFEAAQDGILILDANTGMIEDVNPYLIKLLGYSREEFIKKKLWEVGAFKDIKASQDAFEALQENEYIRYENLPLKAKNGKLIQVEFVSNVYLVGDEKVIQCNIRDITEHKRLILALQENEKKYYDLVNLSPEGVFIIDSSGNVITVNKAICKELGFTEKEFLCMNIWDIIPEQYLEQYREKLTKIFEGKSLEEGQEYSVRGKDGKIHFVEVLAAPRYNDKDIIGFQGIVRDITNRKQAEETLKKEKDRAQQYLEIAGVIFLVLDADRKVILINKKGCEILGNIEQEIVGRNWLDFLPQDQKDRTVAAFDQLMTGVIEPMEYFENPLLTKSGQERLIAWHNSLLTDEAGRIIGVVSSGGDITERKQAEERIRRQLEHLTALSGIDRVISANYDLGLSLSEILKHVVMELGVDATAILLFNSSLQCLEFGAESGFRTNAIRKAKIRLGEDYAGRVALERRLVQISNLQEDPAFHTSLLKDEDFVCLYGVPLIVKGKINGVLEVFQRSILKPDPEWFDFLNSLAGQTAIAIEIASLFADLQNSNSQLTLAYDATIEGWSSALDLRDKETEGHTQRVTQMTVKLARTFGLSEAELVQVRWGALLHDIGKMGVPDGILLKPGPLTDEEWVTMKKHPTFAYEMLAPIRFLRLALDIPYCHHEKWDGTGYPNGLKGTQIPLVARIFAVVDVWDALTSDRPYRAGWTQEKALKNILSESGTHFDPQVVDIFMQNQE